MDKNIEIGILRFKRNRMRKTNADLCIRFKRGKYSTRIVTRDTRIRPHSIKSNAFPYTKNLELSYFGRILHHVELFVYDLVT